MKLLPQNRDLGWVPYAWLIYLSIYITFPILMRASAWAFVAYGVGALAFLVLYFRGFWVSGRSLLPIIGAIAALGLIYMPFNPGANVFFVYAAAFVGQAVTGRTAYWYLAGLIGLLGLESFVFAIGPEAWIPGVVFSVLIGSITIHDAGVQRRNLRLKLAQEEVAHLAKLEERERIARDLHDLLGRSLSLITIKSQLAQRLATEKPGEANEEIEEIERISREALREVRRAVRGYRFQQLSTELAKSRIALESAGVDLDLETGPYHLAPDQESVAALALREAVTNVVRHAKARRCTIRIDSGARHFRLEIEDDGNGIKGPTGSGLDGMRERLESIGGSVSWGPREAGRGTLLVIEIDPRARSTSDGAESEPTYSEPLAG